MYMCVPVHWHTRVCVHKNVRSVGKPFPAYHLTHPLPSTQRPASLAQSPWDNLLKVSEKGPCLELELLGGPGLCILVCCVGTTGCLPASYLAPWGPTPFSVTHPRAQLLHMILSFP